MIPTGACSKTRRKQDRPKRNWLPHGGKQEGEEEEPKEVDEEISLNEREETKAEGREGPQAKEQGGKVKKDKDPKDKRGDQKAEKEDTPQTEPSKPSKGEDAPIPYVEALASDEEDEAKAARGTFQDCDWNGGKGTEV